VTKRRKRKGTEPNCTFQRHTPATQYLKQNPGFFHLPILYSILNASVD
jgi:hypothetical protein